MESGPDITTWLKKVQFKLFHTYSNPLRSMSVSFSAMLTAISPTNFAASSL